MRKLICIGLLVWAMPLVGQVKELEEWLDIPFEERPELPSQDFAFVALDESDAVSAVYNLFHEYEDELAKRYLDQWNNRELVIDGLTMPFYFQRFGTPSDNSTALIISLHGGGGAPKEVNDQQYRNQQHLYDKFLEGKDVLYLAPRAPSNTWNLWHQCEIDQFIYTLIQMAIMEEGVHPARIYLIGYSAGGDGVYQLGTRMADRFTAVSMMAGHPNEVTPVNLRNLPFALHMGALDSAYNRNKVAQKWGELLDSLENESPGDYKHQVRLHQGKGHWMEREDAEALAWLLAFTKIQNPKKISWKQDDCHRSNFYWLETPKKSIKTDGLVEASIDYDKNEIDIQSFYCDTLIINLNDQLLNLNLPVSVRIDGKTKWKQTLHRNLSVTYDMIQKAGGGYHSFYFCRLKIFRLENGTYSIQEQYASKN